MSDEQAALELLRRILTDIGYANWGDMDHPSTHAYGHPWLTVDGTLAVTEDEIRLIERIVDSGQADKP